MFPSFKSFKKTSLNEKEQEQKPRPKSGNDIGNPKFNRVLSTHSNKFEFNRKGDKENFQFESIYKSDIPKYYFGASSILGAHAFKVKKFKGDIQIIDKSVFFAYQLDSSFLNFLKTKRRYHKFAVDPLVTLHRLKEIENSTGDKIEASDFKSIGLPWNEICQWKESLSFPKRDASQYSDERTRIKSILATEPHNVKAWLQLADLELSVTGIKPRSLFERKCSILERGISMNPNSNELITEYCKCLEKFTEITEVLNKWEYFLNKNPSNTHLWMSYINFRVGNFSSFSYSSINHNFLERFKYVVECQNFDNIIELIYICCQFHKACGYNELALSILRAVIEFNVFCPSKFKELPVQVKVRYFEDYWVNCGSKLGESELSGWCNFKSDMKGVFKVEVDRDIAGFSENRKIVRGWLIREDCRSQYKILSSQTCDNWEIILFDDILPYLFEIPEIYHDSLIRLLCSFLDFPLISLPDFQFIATSFNTCHLPSIQALDLNPVEKCMFLLEEFPLDPSNKVLDFKFLSKSISGINFFRRSVWSGCSSFGIDNDRIKFLSNILKSFDSRSPIWKLIDLQLQCLLEPDRAEANIKSLISGEMDNHIYWMCYCEYLIGCNQLSKAEETYSKLLDTFSDRDILLKYVELLLSQGNFRKTEDVLLKAAGCNKDKLASLSPLELLKCKKFYEPGESPVAIYFQFILNDLVTFLRVMNSLKPVSRSPEFMYCLYIATSRNPESLSLILEESEKLPILFQMFFKILLQSKGGIQKSLKTSPRIHESALEEHPNSPALWESYLRLNINFKPSRIEEIHFRAIKSVPFCKNIYLLPFRLSAKMRKKRKLEEIIDIMEEKELSVRTFLEEVSKSVSQ